MDFNKEKNNTTFFVLECERKNVRYIISQELLELMLSTGKGFEHLFHCNYTHRLGWHSGKDNKIYEKYILSNYGEMAYDLLDVKVKRERYLKAFYEITHQINSGNYAKEKNEIYENFKDNFVKRIYKYEGKELNKINSSEQDRIA